MIESGGNFLLETIKSLKGLKSNSEKAIAQISNVEMYFQPDADSNSISILMKHMSGNMISRFTDFLSTDGEKPWRERDEEFSNDNLTREELFSIWEKGWECVLTSISNLNYGDLLKNVYIRGEEHSVMRAILRQLIHYSYHSGQIVYLCKQIRKSDFISLSIPKNKS